MTAKKTPFVAFLKASAFADFLRDPQGNIRLFANIHDAEIALEHARAHLANSEARGLVYRRHSLRLVHTIAM